MIVEMRNVDKRYGQVDALAGATMSVPAGAIYGLIGPNGAGKTTSMQIMSSLLSRDGGSVEVAGVDPELDPVAVRRELGWMPDFFGVYEGLNASEYLDFFAAVHEVRAGARPAVVRDLLELVSLVDKADADVNTLSRGMKQRLSLARALIHDPELLVLDEPASGLDPRARVELRELIAELQRMGRTIVISSHILSELEGVCSHLAIVDQGRFLAQGPIEEIRSKLFAQRRVRARVEPSQIEAAEAWLQDQGSVGDLEVERGVIRFLFSGDDAASASVLGGLIAAGVPVSEWRVDGAGLEEVFLHLTSNGEADAARSGAGEGAAS